MRFPNEFDAVKSRDGITIRVNRTNRWNKPQDIEHASETALDNHEFDYVINNTGSMSDLILKVREILTQNQII
jgi:F420-dependent methylenetetrahydromethanopterin dehydrogenase